MKKPERSVEAIKTISFLPLTFVVFSKEYFERPLFNKVTRILKRTMTEIKKNTNLMKTLNMKVTKPLLRRQNKSSPFLYSA